MKEGLINWAVKFFETNFILFPESLWLPMAVWKLVRWPRQAAPL